MLHYIFLIVFLVSAAVHLYASAKQDQKLRRQTKPILLLALLGFYCFAAAQIRLTVVLALFFSWLGDVLLMKKGVKWFTAGGIAFMISHGFFIAAYCRDIDFSALSPLIIVLLGGACAGLVCFLFSRLKPHLPRRLFYPMALYLFINGTMNCFAIFRFLSRPALWSLCTCLGAILFFISDTCLFFVRFHKSSRQKTHFWVMLTYTLGELLIVLGLLNP